MTSLSQSAVPIIFVTGVSGCGKSSVAVALSEQFGLPFLEGDDFHPAQNVTAMAAGQALTDEMRWPWLRQLATAAREAAQAKGGAVVSCSGLKRSYRDLLREVAGGGYVVLLHGDRDIIFERMQARTDHYMPASLLDSQIATLELPEIDEENTLQFQVHAPLEEIINSVQKSLNTLLHRS
jgi:carbohydrate kinase (thermoresistant glucokinase family)